MSFCSERLCELMIQRACASFCSERLCEFLFRELVRVFILLDFVSLLFRGLFEVQRGCLIFYFERLLKMFREVFFFSECEFIFREPVQVFILRACELYAKRLCKFIVREVVF